MTAVQEPTCPPIIPGMGRFIPPADPLREVFTEDVRRTWRESLDQDILHRLQVLCACGPYPSDSTAAIQLRRLRAQEAAWETYLFTAFACGMFEGDRGKELRSRLASRDPEDFRSAMAECEACWFLAGRMRLPVDPVAPGRRGKNLDMRVVFGNGDFGVEVKAPHRERPLRGMWCGDDSDKISQAMEAANKQFDRQKPNLLCIVPTLRSRMFSERRDLLKAAFGQSMITWQVNPRTAEYGPTHVEFQPDGKFLNTERPGGKPLKPDGFPGYRRISAVICIEEKLAEKYPLSIPFFALDDELRHSMMPHWERTRDLHFSEENEVWIDHDVLVLHNPYAYHSVPQDIWSEFPQLVPVDDLMQWTDGAEVVV